MTYVTDTCLTNVQLLCPFIGETFIFEGFLEVNFHTGLLLFHFLID